VSEEKESSRKEMAYIQHQQLIYENSRLKAEIEFKNEIFGIKRKRFVAAAIVIQRAWRA
jgi:hypothetical protein